MSAGHAAALPVHASAASQPFATAARHTVPLTTPTSAGHDEPVPLHVSATSQPFATAARQTVPFETLDHVVGPEAVVGDTHTWQLFAGFSWPFVAHTPPTRQKPSSTRPLQSLSMPSQISAAAVHAGRVAVTTKFAHIVAPTVRYRRTYAGSGHATLRFA
jgi:hypothetical protein